LLQRGNTDVSSHITIERIDERQSVLEHLAISGLLAKYASAYALTDRYDAAQLQGIIQARNETLWWDVATHQQIGLLQRDLHRFLIYPELDIARMDFADQLFAQFDIDLRTDSLPCYLSLTPLVVEEYSCADQLRWRGVGHLMSASRLSHRAEHLTDRDHASAMERSWAEMEKGNELIMEAHDLEHQDHLRDSGRLKEAPELIWQLDQVGLAEGAPPASSISRSEARRLLRSLCCVNDSSWWDRATVAEFVTKFSAAAHCQNLHPLRREAHQKMVKNFRSLFDVELPRGTYVMTENPWI